MGGHENEEFWQPNKEIENGISFHDN